MSSVRFGVSNRSAADAIVSLTMCWPWLTVALVISSTNDSLLCVVSMVLCGANGMPMPIFNISSMMKIGGTRKITSTKPSIFVRTDMMVVCGGSSALTAQCLHSIKLLSPISDVYEWPSSTIYLYHMVSVHLFERFFQVIRDGDPNLFSLIDAKYDWYHVCTKFTRDHVFSLISHRPHSVSMILFTNHNTLFFLFSVSIEIHNILATARNYETNSDCKTSIYIYIRKSVLVVLSWLAEWHFDSSRIVALPEYSLLLS